MEGPSEPTKLTKSQKNRMAKLKKEGKWNPDQNAFGEERKAKAGKHRVEQTVFYSNRAESRPMPADIKLEALKISHPDIYEAFQDHEVRQRIVTDMHPLLVRCIVWHATARSENFDLRQGLSQIRYNQVYACLHSANGKYASSVPPHELAWFKAVSDMRNNLWDFEARDAYIQGCIDRHSSSWNYEGADELIDSYLQFERIKALLRSKADEQEKVREALERIQASSVRGKGKGKMGSGDGDVDMGGTDDIQQPTNRANYADKMKDDVLTAFAGMSVEVRKAQYDDFARSDVDFPDPDPDSVFVPE